MGQDSGFAGTAGYIASKGLPLPEVGAVIAIVVELIGGIMLPSGSRRAGCRGALPLPHSDHILFHPFWVDPAQATSFWKNVGIMGGLLYVWAFGAGRLSIDRLRRKRCLQR